MIGEQRCRRHGMLRRCGLTMVEMVVSAAILGGVGVIALQGIAAINKSHLDTVDLARAELLARELMDEILQQPFGPSETDVGSVGAAATNRVTFNSIDDYDRWNESMTLPPQHQDGTLIELGNGWARRVVVTEISGIGFTSSIDQQKEIRSIEVIVSRFEVDLVRLKSMRSSTWKRNRVLNQSDG